MPCTRQSRAQWRRRALAGRVEQHRARRARARGSPAAPHPAGCHHAVSTRADFGVQPASIPASTTSASCSRNLPRLPQHAREDRASRRSSHSSTGTGAQASSCLDHTRCAGASRSTTTCGSGIHTVKLCAASCVRRCVSRAQPDAQPGSHAVSHRPRRDSRQGARRLCDTFGRRAPRQVCQTARAKKRRSPTTPARRAGDPAVRGVEALQARRGCCKHERVGGNGLARHQSPIAAHELEACCNSIRQNLPKFLNKAIISIFENKTQKILHLGVC